MAPFKEVPRIESAIGRLALLAIAAVIGFIAVITPLDLRNQAIFGALASIVVLLLSQNRGHFVTIFLNGLSAVLSTRYLYWRITGTIPSDPWWDALIGVLLVGAEIYFWAVLLISHCQTVWPLERKPATMPDDPATWPSVDIFIPTYNEPLDVVCDAVLAAQCIDYPADRLRIFLCDDGRREEFRKFAAEAGVGYIIRPDNAHAKAGNLNNALKQTSSELIAIFDCDHIPNRAFLQMTVGWFLRDRKLAMLQTPHHYFSPDPIERNLPVGRAVPNEGNLFYGLLQDGNDFWNATFFCGSCAVLRRSALGDVGGFAPQTVTEDCHTALKMHQRGWTTAYIKIPLAAGLATERLALHVAQRMRWARGLTQVFRLDNPVFCRGLELGQRLCYLSATVHYFFAIPRIIVLLAPIPYLLLNMTIIDASGWMILAYGIPHLLASTVTNARRQGPNRHSFWGEVYEDILAFALVRPTMSALLDPRRGKFNVTEKGGILSRAFFDLRSVRLHIIVAALLVASIVVGVGRIFGYFGHYNTDLEVVLITLGWAIHNLLMLGAAIAVARETRQIRGTVRIDARIPAIVHFRSGRTLVTHTQNISMGGALLAPQKMQDVAPGENVYLEFDCSGEVGVFPCTIVDNNAAGMRLAIEELNVDQRRLLVRGFMGRADAWLHWNDYRNDTPFRGIWEIIRCNLALLRPLSKQHAGSTPDRINGVTGAAVKAAVALLVFLLAAGSAWAQAGQSPSTAPTPPPVSGAPAATAPLGAPPLDAAEGQGRVEIVSLGADLGVLTPIRLSGAAPEYSLPLTIRRDQVVTAAKITVNLHYSPALLPDLSYLHVLLNDELVGSVQLLRERADNVTVEFTINPLLFRDVNRLLFRFTGHYTTTECEDPLHSTLWAAVSNERTFLTLTLEHLPVPNDLALLPRPFFDPLDVHPLRLPVVFSANPSLTTLQAAGIVSSWFGGLAEHQGAAFPVEFDRAPNGNAVVLATSSEQPAGIPLPNIAGPMLAVVGNPNDRAGKLLLVMGRNAEELRAAARSLAVGAHVLTGASAAVSAPVIAPRRPYDAPYWLRTDRPVHFGEILAPEALQGKGLQPGILSVNFRTAPDLFLWPDSGVPLDLRYRYPTGGWFNADLSRLDVSLNDRFVKTLPLGNVGFLDRSWDRIFGGSYTAHEAKMMLPPYEVFGRNQLQFYYDLKVRDAGACQRVVPNNVTSAIDPDSTIDLSGISRFAAMPNLAFFANSGFPFTRLADLSETAIVMPDKLSAADIETFLDLMGFIGESTGFPADNSIVVQANGVDSVADKDILVIGSYANQPLLARWAAAGSLQLRNGQIQLDVTAAGPIGRTLGFFDLDPLVRGREAASQLLVSADQNIAALIGMQSPLRRGRSVVMLVSATPQRMLDMINAFRSKDHNAEVQGDFAVLSGSRISSFRIGNTYDVGYLPFWTRARWYMSDRPFALTAVVLVGVLLFAIVAYWLARRRAEARLAASEAAAPPDWRRRGP